MNSPTDETAAAIAALLDSVSTLGLCTTAEDGTPHACNVNFARAEGLELLFISLPGSAHARHLTARPRIAATAYLPFHAPSEIRGVQLHGDCRPEPADRFEENWKRFIKKFPYALAMADRARAECFYRIRPHWGRLIDNRVHFGFKKEWGESP